MVNGKYISLNEVLWRVMRNPLMEELDYDEAATHTVDVLKLIGAPLIYGSKSVSLEVKDYRAVLPNNLLNIKAIRHNGARVQYASNTFHDIDESESCIPIGPHTYTLNNCIITTSFEHGDIDVSYTYIVTDDEGYPMIPDNISVLRAIEYHVQMMHLEPFWMMGKITDKAFNHIQQQRAWYVGQAQSATVIQGLDQLATIINGLNRLIINDDAYQTFYKEFGSKERLKRFD